MTQPQPETPVFDSRYVAYVFNQRGYHVNELASRLDLSNGVVEAFLRGTVEPGDLRIATLVNMANLLGIPLHALFARPAPAPDPDELLDTTTTTQADAENGCAPTLAADAEQLIAVLYDTGRVTPTIIAEIAKAFDWTLDRFHAAADEATRRLQPAGLRTVTMHGEICIVPVNDHHLAHKALINRKINERGLTLLHYKAVHQLLSGQQVTVRTTGLQRRRTLGGLVNLGIVNNYKNPELTDAAREAFPGLPKPTKAPKKAPVSKKAAGSRKKKSPDPATSLFATPRPRPRP